MKRDNAIICGVFTSKDVDYEYELLELKNLANAALIDVKDQMIQFLNKPHPNSYLGTGKVEELKKSIEILNVDMVIFNDTLSPSQINYLEKNLDTQVIDRSFLILSIFSIRAKTKLAKLEVDLAQKMYMLPRLIGLGNILSRQGGGSYNAKGPGETKLELDRRKILTDISNIKQSLKKAHKENEVSRKQRKAGYIPIVALVGYTNVGKSSLVNALAKQLNNLDEVVFEKDMLFATLDTKTIKLQKKNHPPFLLIDTVGFVSKLPHELINSFKSTLADVLDADLIIHVLDGSNLNIEHMRMTQVILEAINADKIPMITVLTKKDLVIDPIYEELSYTFVSNKTLENIDLLTNEIYANIYTDYRLIQLKLDYSKSNLLSQIYNNYHVLKQIDTKEHYLLNLYLKNYQITELSNLISSKKNDSDF